MTERKVKKSVIYLGYTLGLLLLVGLFTIVEVKLNKKTPEEKDYVNKTIFENKIPVVGSLEIIARPYTDNTVKIATNYYNKQDDEETQKKSLILFENTYLPSTGIDYQSDYDFDVVSILDGIVVTVKEDQTLGRIVEIKHKNNIISTYQSLSEVLIKERVLEEAKYMIKTKETVREIAKVFNVSKSTVHKDLHERLIQLDNILSEQVEKILKYHTDIRHIRGGESTKKKYLKMSN